VFKDEYLHHYQFEIIDANKTKTIMLRKVPAKIMFIPYVEYILSYFEETTKAFIEALMQYPELVSAYPSLLDLASYIRSIYFGTPAGIFDIMLRFIPRAVLTSSSNIKLGSDLSTLQLILQKLTSKTSLSATASISVYASVS